MKTNAFKVSSYLLTPIGLLRPIGEGCRVADLRLEAEPETGRRAERIDEGVKQ
jgi:hypothetical protein